MSTPDAEAAGTRPALVRHLSMVNLIETLFGLAGVAAVAALVAWARKRRAGARRLGAAAAAFAILGAALELYARTRG